LENGQVTFRWRDSKDSNRIKAMTLEATEFIRRFLLHILPSGFVKIRHFGFLSNRRQRFRLLGSNGCGLGRLLSFRGRCRHLNSPSGRLPRHDMDHSGSPEKQANSVGNRNWRSNGDGTVLRLQLAAVGI
jgi:Putative transposase